MADILNKPVLKNIKGQSLFEVVVALAISALIIVALVSLAASSIRNATFSRNKTVASRYAEEATEWLRGQRDGNTQVFFANTLSPFWCLTNVSSWPATSVGSAEDCTEFIDSTIFIRYVEFSRSIVGDNKNLITANVVVSWQDAQGTHEIRSVTYFSDWRER